MTKHRIGTIIILIAIVALGYFVYATESDGEEGRFDFKMGLDLAGGTQLTYEADTSSLKTDEVGSAMSALREVIERRVNSQDVSGALGVLEPDVRIEEGSLLGSGGQEQRIIVELPGITEVQKAKDQIGRTPLLEFKLINESALSVSNINLGLTNEEGSATSSNATTTPTATSSPFIDTGLTGRYVIDAQLTFDNLGQPTVLLEFNREGSELFEEITRNHTGEPLAILLDGEVKSAPVIQDVIRGGTASITGLDSIDEARELVRDLDFGALPVPISLVEEQTIGPSLGEDAVNAGVTAGVIGLVLVVVFLILWYRLPGILATVALLAYVVIMLSLFKLVPVTLTTAGIAGFILSIGMAVDANVLIFERFKEEKRAGKSLKESVEEGFRRAWLSIRDANSSTLITAIILFYATTSLVKGFALVLGIGVLVSMFSAITITRTMMLAIMPKNEEAGKQSFLFGSGFNK